MKIYTFIEQFCSDIIKEVQERKQVIDLTEFPYDEIVTDNEGKKYPAINIDGIMVPLNDLFVMERVDFIREWKLPSAAESYDNYMSNMDVLEGEEAVAKIRLALKAEADRLSSINVDDIPDYVV